MPKVNCSIVMGIISLSYHLINYLKKFFHQNFNPIFLFILEPGEAPATTYDVFLDTDAGVSPKARTFSFAASRSLSPPA